MTWPPGATTSGLTKPSKVGPVEENEARKSSFASVLAAPLAVAVAMTWGYHVVAGLALCAYAVAGLGFARLPSVR